MKKDAIVAVAQASGIMCHETRQGEIVVMGNTEEWEKFAAELRAAPADAARDLQPAEGQG